VPVAAAADSGCSNTVLCVGLVCLTSDSDHTTASFFAFAAREGNIVDWLAVWSDDWPWPLAGKANKAESTSHAIRKREPRAVIGYQFSVISFK
jgi:hypothetical protein